MPARAFQWFVLGLIASCCSPLVNGAETTKFASHPPMRALPVPSKRPMADGPAYFVAPKGDDAQEGTKEKPWKTVRSALKRLKPGDTLYLRSGTYYEALTIAVFGTADKPITIRS